VLDKLVLGAEFAVHLVFPLVFPWPRALSRNNYLGTDQSLSDQGKKSAFGYSNETNINESMCYVRIAITLAPHNRLLDYIPNRKNRMEVFNIHHSHKRLIIEDPKSTLYALYTITYFDNVILYSIPIVTVLSFCSYC